MIPMPLIDDKSDAGRSALDEFKEMNSVAAQGLRS
jgi:hypothetical protein